MRQYQKRGAAADIAIPGQGRRSLIETRRSAMATEDVVSTTSSVPGFAFFICANLWKTSVTKTSAVAHTSFSCLALRRWRRAPGGSSMAVAALSISLGNLKQILRLHDGG